MTLQDQMKVYTDDSLNQSIPGRERSRPGRIARNDCYRVQICQSPRQNRTKALGSDILAFIGIRYCSHSHFGPAVTSVFIVKQPKVFMTAQAFMASLGRYCNRHYRFEIIAVDGPRGNTTAQRLN